MYIQPTIKMESIAGGRYKLLEPFVFVYSLSLHKIPRGFIWNGGSIPDIAKSFVGGSMEDNHRRAYLIHDYLYQTKIFSRKKSDNALYEALKECGVGYFSRQTIYWAVRIGGGSNYEY